MHRHGFLRNLHAVYQPRTYFEIGINDGRSLTLSRVPTVAVDPAFKVVKELRCDLHMVRETSDDFFAREKPLEHLGEAKVDLAFIDGMHLFEYVLRDFINTEKYADWSSVVVFDDQLPRNVDEAARNRHTGAWTGDVYKMIPVLQRYRPDLRLAVMDTRPTGVMVVLGLDPTNTVLADNYDEIMDTFLLKDPQQIPPEIVERSCAMTPEALLSAPFWSALVAARDVGDPSYGREQLLAGIDHDLADLSRPQLCDWLPDPAAGRDCEVDQSASVGEHRMVAAIRQKAAAKASGIQSRNGAGSTAQHAATATKQAGATRPPRRVSRRPSDLFGKVAKRAPFLRRLPGAPRLVKKLR
ncbi:class I SAM-dependent methyltransferase [Actinopolymorpha sp. B11F2]|uniref:class I SAM-dependent methyltransferase n=1 Tax=Actinopolymorpha sp. B11F2 TaxID=3160862 RepID=UPI0032E5159D